MQPCCDVCGKMREYYPELHIDLEQEKYLTSRDAIIPVIEKQPHDIKLRFHGEAAVVCRAFGYLDEAIYLTPRQLCIALLKATGKWKV
jgi:hypothetical protein